MKILWTVVTDDSAHHYEADLTGEAEPLRSGPSLQQLPFYDVVAHQARFVLAVDVGTGRTWVLKSRYGKLGEVERVPGT